MPRAKGLREPDVGNPHVRFDEGEMETAPLGRVSVRTCPNASCVRVVTFPRKSLTLARRPAASYVRVAVSPGGLVMPVILDRASYENVRVFKSASVVDAGLPSAS